MLHCIMAALAPSRLRQGLEDLVADLVHSRKQGDLGRLALLSYCELRRWARIAQHPALELRSTELFVGAPYDDRDTFVQKVDALITEAQGTLESLRRQEFDSHPLVA